MGQAGRRWVVLDVGEVLIDETRVWRTWAEHLGLPAFTLMAAIGAVVAGGGDHVEAFRLLGVADWAAHEAAVQDRFGGFQAEDLYDDALSSVAALRAAGYGVAVMGNQPAQRSRELIALGLDADIVLMSDELGAAKPDPAFFAAVLRQTGAAAADIAYVGDRVDNDVAPTVAAGMRAVWLRRGPWGALHTRPAGLPALEVASLAELAADPARCWAQA